MTVAALRSKPAPTVRTESAHFQEITGRGAPFHYTPNVEGRPSKMTTAYGPYGGFMKKISAVALLLVSLSMPALASPRSDDSPRGRANPIQRVVKILKGLFASVMDDSWDISVPKP